MSIEIRKVRGHPLAMDVDHGSTLFIEIVIYG
jgi:hypothetical protein